jgi:hypothetical protein
MVVSLSEDARQITSSHCVVAAADFGHSKNSRGFCIQGASLKNWLFLGIENPFGFWILPIVLTVLLARQ